MPRASSKYIYTYIFPSPYESILQGSTQGKGCNQNGVKSYYLDIAL